MNQYNFPTTILCGNGALSEFVDRLEKRDHQRVLVVTDKNLVACGLLDALTKPLETKGIAYSVFDEVHPNPIEADIDKGAAAYQKEGCDSIIALGGGSPIDAAKAIRVMAVHPGPLSQYDESIGGDQRIVHPMPALYAIPTTAGTGSEVGRSAVIILKSSGKKAIFFHPDLTPDLAVLEPALTTGLPAAITAATGIDALVHCLEAYLAPGFHPMADGIALEGLAIVLDWLPVAVEQGDHLIARERMLLAASMGATAFQKGLGMIHSLAHPLSSRFNLHHGLANALLLPAGVVFLEDADLTLEQTARLGQVQLLFAQKGWEPPLSEACRRLLTSIGIRLGLREEGIQEKDLNMLSREAYDDPCHQTNMVSVNQSDLLSVYREAL